MMSNSRKRRKTSTVWDYYRESSVDNIARYACIVQNFKQNFSLRSPTSTLRGHLKDNGFFLDDKQTHLNIDGGISHERPIPKEQKQQDISTAICQWIVDTGLPFCTLDNQYFKTIMRIMDSRIDIPSRTTVSRTIISMCKSHELSF